MVACHTVICIMTDTGTRQQIQGELKWAQQHHGFREEFLFSFQWKARKLHVVYHYKNNDSVKGGIGFQILRAYHTPNAIFSIGGNT